MVESNVDRDHRRYIQQWDVSAGFGFVYIDIYCSSLFAPLLLSVLLSVLLGVCHDTFVSKASQCQTFTAQQRRTHVAKKICLKRDCHSQNVVSWIKPRVNPIF